MVGIVCEVQSYDDCVIVYYPFEDIKVKYTESMFKKKWIGYAWSLTVHKTQGSEYNNIVIPFTSSHWRMLDNQLTYTAITRAKESCHLVGTVKAFHQACTNTDTIKRDTVYQYLFNNNLTSLDILYPN
jgi:exodeoxyribonuclease V alpha subunit